MDLSIPAALESLGAAGAAIAELASWRRRARGDARALVGELKDNLVYLDMVARGDVDLAAIVERLSIDEYQRLARAGFDFNRLKRGAIKLDKSLAGTDLANWRGKKTAELVDAIYDKINELKLRHPLVGEGGSYRWTVRVNNIRKRIWLLLMHVKE